MHPKNVEGFYDASKEFRKCGIFKDGRFLRFWASEPESGVSINKCVFSLFSKLPKSDQVLCFLWSLFFSERGQIKM